jgi:myo-inositol-1(or 4)-monophosphatase
MTTDLRDLLAVALSGADIARNLIRDRRPTVITEKSDRDLVSDVDLKAERAVRGHLREATPGIAFLGEEEGASGDSGAKWRWVLDPVDGTSNFAHGSPLCATSLALVHEDRPVLGVIDIPFLAERYHAVEGGGAWNGARRLTVSSTASLRDAIVAIGDYATGPGSERRNQAELAMTASLIPRVHRIRMLGTAAVDLAWVADGKLDASITLDHQPWDTAAGVIIAGEAGAVIVDADGSPHTLHSAGTIAAGPELIQQIALLVHKSGTPPLPK